ncbi:MAG: hypothetical protein ACOYXT_12650 [Bacteroidota bacterium]
MRAIRTENFLALDRGDIDMLSRLKRRSTDFAKLDDVDQRILVWLLSHKPVRIRSWIDFLSSEYRSRQLAEFDTKALLGVLEILIRGS